ncbi:MAG: large subunit ribosomal protein [Halanaerobiales bacterium]|nr:large subunit ribosomal protein [Halanaerobiales bacterium]
MKRYNLQAEVREETGKGVARKLRRAGLLPGVVYGKTRKSQPLIVDPIQLQNKMSGNVIFDLTIVDDDKETKETVMIKEIQRDPIKGDLLHIDFQHISMDEKISVSIPLSLKGDAPGVKEGGVLQQLLREVEIECLPADIPEELELDISDLHIGDSLMVSDLDVPEEIEIKTPLDEVIVTVVAPTELVEEEIEEEEEEFVEPEVIGEEEAKKEEE